MYCSYCSASLREGPGAGDCSGWERDAQSFSRVIAKHHIQVELGRPLDVVRMSKASSTAWRIEFPNKIAVFVTLSRVPDFVAAARWEPKPAAKTRFYTYSCTAEGRLIFRERGPP